MYILIEKPETLEYLSTNGRWTKDPIGGKCFPSTRMAVRAAKQEAIDRFSVVRYIPNTNQFVNLAHGRGTGAPEVLAQV